LYSTCIFCHSSLGKNEAIEQFPIGRKLAFDGAKGRLWAVCAKCGRWNLTPIEERWEAIEECEKQFRGTILRSSTDHIGLARVREGTDLIRIGEPLRPEFAAWRYAHHFRRRMRLQQASVAGSMALSLAATALTGSLFSFGGLGAPLIFKLITRRSELGRARKFIVQRAEQGFGRRIWRQEGVGVRIIPTTDEQGWGIRFSLDAKFLDFHGRDALHTAQIIAPAMNATGARTSDVNLAVREIEIAKSPEMYFRKFLKYGQSKGWSYTGIAEFPTHMRLALEMSAHEESERIAIEGELAQLEADWKEAEEIASISDNMFLPQSITDFISRAKR
jgi:hypothetical protein